MILHRYSPPPDERLVEGLTIEATCERYAGPILRLARRIAAMAGPDCALTTDDLVAYGVLGLLEAFDRFGAEHETGFAAYASFRIRGQMYDAILGESGQTRRERQIADELTRTAATLHAELGRDATHSELATRLGVSVDVCWRMRQVATPVTLVPLPDAEELTTEPARAPLRLAARDARQTLRDAIGRLPKRELTVIQLYYSRECSLAEIGAILEVSPSRVCQILGDARSRLRRDLASAVGMDSTSIDGAE